MFATKCWVAFLLLTVCANVFADDSTCMAYILYKESRGESLKVARAVADVVENRANRSGKSICQIMREPGQFPYVKKRTKIVVDSNARSRYYTVIEMDAVLGPNFMYFNHKRQKWGKHPRKIGKLYFSELK